MGNSEDSPADQKSAAYQLFLLVLSIYVLTVLALETWVVSDPEIGQVLQFIDFSICLVFLGDFFWNLYTAENRLKYLKWGWIDFVSSLPAVDPLRWGRLSRVVRIIRFLRAIKSFKILMNSLQNSRFESLTLIVLLITFLAFTLCSSLILEYEREYDSSIRVAKDALWWSFLNIMNAKVSITTAQSSEGMVLTVILNKVGFLLFAYFNAIIIAWLIQKRVSIKEEKAKKAVSSTQGLGDTQHRE